MISNKYIRFIVSRSSTQLLEYQLQACTRPVHAASEHQGLEWFFVHDSPTDLQYSSFMFPYLSCQSLWVQMASQTNCVEFARILWITETAGSPNAAAQTSTHYDIFRSFQRAIERGCAMGLRLNSLMGERHTESYWALESHGVLRNTLTCFTSLSYGDLTLALELCSVMPKRIEMFERTSLWWAATGGHADMIRFLVQAGADLDAEEKIRGLEPLHQAASKNHAEAVRALLEAGVDALTPRTREYCGRRCGNAARTRGHTPLMYACKNGHLEALEVFLPFLSDIDVVQRALAWSITPGRPELVKRLLQFPGVNPNARLRRDTLLYLACKTLNLDSIVALMEAGADPSILSVAASDEFAGMGWVRMSSLSRSQDGSRGYTALHALCSSRPNGYTRAEKIEPIALQELVNLLLQHGVSLDVHTDIGRTALHAAVHSPVLTKLLLQAGADPNAVDDNGNTPLHCATLSETIALLVEEGQAKINMFAPQDGRTPLLRMLDGQHKEAVLKLLRYRPDLTFKDTKGDGPLHLAIKSYRADLSIIQILLDAGADPDERNRTGHTPLLAMQTSSRDSIAVIDLLLKLGADIHAGNSSGHTVLLRTLRQRSCAGKSDYADIQELLDRGATLHTLDHKGKSMLHHAVATYDLTRFAFARDHSTSRPDQLIKPGVDVQAVDYQGSSLVHELAMQSHVSNFYDGPGFIPLRGHLLDLGIDLNRGNQQGRTALHILSASRFSLHGSSSTGSKVGYVGPLDFIISRCRDIDQCDNQDCPISSLLNHSVSLYFRY